jgi:uncharacterized protein YjiS (DUF1127 family)
MTRKDQGMWTELKRKLVAWQIYENAQFEMRDLSDRTLRDIGFRPADRGTDLAAPFRLN